MAHPARSRFPDPRSAPADEPLAYGGDLEPATLVEAYSLGIFPWPSADGTLFWWSPDPRAIIPPEGAHVSRSLRRTMRSGRFHCTLDQAFDTVVAGCADRAEGTWITTEMAQAYGRLHALGHAHSIEVWDQQRALVGGLYGVAVGGAFSGESMFHRARDASKVALIVLLDVLSAAGFVLFDAQLPTPHLTRLGALAVDRAEFLERLAHARQRRCRLTEVLNAQPTSPSQFGSLARALWRPAPGRLPAGERRDA